VRRGLVLIAVVLVALSGCGGGGAQTNSKQAAEEDASRARYAVEHLKSVCPHGKVAVEVSNPGRSSSSCVGHAIAVMIERIKRLCPSEHVVMKMHADTTIWTCARSGGG
jgi:hypothetical protein